MSSRSDIENEDPSDGMRGRKVPKPSDLFDELERLKPEDIDNLRPSFACFEDTSYHVADVSASVIRNMGQEFAALAEDENEKICTYLRIRPAPKHKKGEPFTSDLYSVEDDYTLKIRGNQIVKRSNPYADETIFKFSKIFGPDCSQSTVFEECVQPILEKFFHGENCLIFSYGATNSGKTYTMQGYGTQFGIVPRTLDHMYNILEDRLYTAGNIKPNLFNAFLSLSDVDTRALEDTKQRVLKEVKSKSAEMNSFRASFGLSRSSSASSISCSSNGTLAGKILNINSVPQSSAELYSSNIELYAVWVSFIEIYNERVYDLFEQVQRGKKRKELKLLADKEGRVYIKDLTELSANSAEEAYQLFLAGKTNLQFAATQANQNSSRSHSFFNIRMVAVGVAEKIAYPKRVFQMSFCDLAGIERVSQTGNFGVRLKESGNINQSLLVLLKCIRAMRDKQHSKHPVEVLSFRESKLTRLFQGYLMATTHTRMIVNINPELEMFESSFQVLQNSAVASEVITYRRVEPPSNDTAFSRRVRDSIGFINQMREELNGTLNDTLNESDEFAAATVVAKCKIPAEALKDKVSRLEMENAALKQELRTVEDRVRKELCASFAAIQQEYEDNQKQREKEKEVAIRNLNDRRVSIAFRIMMSEKEDKQVGTSPMPASQSIVCSPEQDQDGFSTPTNRSINFREEWKREQGVAADLRQKNKEQHEVIMALQKALEGRLNEIVNLQSERKEREALLNSRIDDLHHVLELKEEEIRRVKQQDPVKLQDENLKHIEKLSEEIKVLTEMVASKDAELADAVQTCLAYDQKLEEANNKITQLSIDFNKLHKEHAEIVEENDIMHLSVDDLNMKLEERQREIEQLKNLTAHYGTRSSKSTRRNLNKQ